MTIKPGDALPSVPVRLVDADGTRETDTGAIFGQGRVVLFAVPGAFTPACDTSHLPGFVAAYDQLKAAGIDRIICAAANDHHVVKAWAERSNALGKVDFIADPHLLLAEAIGLTRNFPDLGRRYARFALIAEAGMVRQLFVQDVAGVTVSGAPAILHALQGEVVS